MESAEPVKFVDKDSGDEAYIFVRFNADCVALCISLKSNGDCEATMTKDTARKVIATLQKAVSEDSRN